MTQLSFSDAEHAGKRKRTRREVFLAQMDQVVPWSALLSQIAPHYPKAGRGRHPYGLETMLRIHFLQQWYALSDPAMEEALYEIASMRQFARVSLLEAIPDETTILNFRHFLERHGLAPKLLEAVNRHLQGKGLPGGHRDLRLRRCRRCEFTIPPNGLPFADSSMRNYGWPAATPAERAT